jgi:site-specific DNA-methyltransferase (adenine-specific)
MNKGAESLASSNFVATPDFHFYAGDVLDVYGKWPSPQAIISDGAYGVRGFEGDTTGVSGLPEWYRPHLEAWDKFARPSTALWFWNTEIGWATVHPMIEGHGWKYVQTITWDKGLAHIAGNVNGNTIRQYPVVTEICVLYQRPFAFRTNDGILNTQKWLHDEWQRAGIPLSRANEACGVKNAATRKYLTQDWMWYWPPGEMVEKMAAYAAQHGDPDGMPYFSLDGKNSVSAKEWDSLRYVWNHVHGLTNVWNEGPLQGEERLHGGDSKSAPRSAAKTQAAAFHLNQKPLEFMRRIIASTTNENDIVWEPFGGLASASVAAIELNRHPCAAEINEKFQEAAKARLVEASEKPRQLRFIV